MTITRLDALERTTQEHAAKLAEHERRIARQEEDWSKVLAALGRLEASLTDLDLVRREVVGLRTLVAQALSVGHTTRISDRPISRHDFDQRMSELEEKTSPGIILETGVKLWLMRAVTWGASEAGKRAAVLVGGASLLGLYHLILALTHHLR
jgi:hypothetical protein